MEFKSNNRSICPASMVTIILLISLFMSTNYSSVNSAPTAAIEQNNPSIQTESSISDKDTLEQQSSPPAGVFVSPWSGLDGRSNVRVGLPFIFGMDLNRNRDRSTGNQTRLDLGVLGGLVRVSMDRFRGANGTKSGPVEVSIFGIPVTSG